MPSYGRQTFSTTGIPLQVLALPDQADWKAGGITIDWSLVTAETSDRTLADGTVIKAGAKGLEAGTILCAKITAEVQTITISATGGTFTISGNGNTSGAIAYNASAATVQTAIRALGGAYANATVSGSAGGPYTITFASGSGDVTALTTNAASLTGGSGTATVATSTAGVGTGTYGPYSSAATDGRQNLVRGYCFILNESVLEHGEAGSLVGVASDHPAVFDGGLVWKARLKVGGDNPSVSIGGLQPTWSAFETAFPRISYAIV